MKNGGKHELASNKTKCGRHSDRISQLLSLFRFTLELSSCRKHGRVEYCRWRQDCMEPSHAAFTHCLGLQRSAIGRYHYGGALVCFRTGCVLDWILVPEHRLHRLHYGGRGTPRLPGGKAFQSSSLTAQLVVPPWPYFRRNPIKWLPAKSSKWPEKQHRCWWINIRIARKWGQGFRDG